MRDKMILIEIFHELGYDIYIVNDLRSRVKKIKILCNINLD